MMGEASATRKIKMPRKAAAPVEFEQPVTIRASSQDYFGVAC